MTNRYSYAEKLKTRDSKRQYIESVIYPLIRPTDDDIYIIAEDMDKLDILAYKYYGDASYWWIIAVANNINDATLYIEAGRQIRIPSNIGAILQTLKSINYN